MCNAHLTPHGYCSSLRTRGLEGQTGEVTLLCLHARPQLSSFMLNFSSPCLPVSPLLRQLWPRVPHYQLGKGNCDLVRACTEPSLEDSWLREVKPQPYKSFSSSQVNQQSMAPHSVRFRVGKVDWILEYRSELTPRHFHSTLRQIAGEAGG